MPVISPEKELPQPRMVLGSSQSTELGIRECPRAGMPCATSSDAVTGYGSAMTWVRLGVGILLGLLGLVWVGQGFNLIKGSMMTGQVQWAVIGVVLILLAVWLLWGVARDRGWLRSAS
jgi:hypothetical protein